MALSLVMPSGWSTANGYTYTDPSTGQTWYGTIGDNSVLPTPGGNTSTIPPLGTGGNTSWTATAPGGTGGSTASSGISGLIDAAAYGNTQNFELEKQKVDAAIEDANRRYQLAKNADDRAAALQDWQFWQGEQNRILAEQSRYTDLAKTLLNAAVEKSSRPNDYYQYNKLMSGGRDIFSQVSGGAQPAFQAAAGPFEPGNITDILARLGVPAFKQTTPYAGGSGTGGTGGAGIPGVPAPGQSGVTQAQADAVADGLGIDRKFLYQYVQEKGSLPDLPSLNAWMTSKGYRNANGSMTGRVPNVGWQGARGDAVPGAVGGSGPGAAATAKAPVGTATTAAPAQSDVAARFGPMYAGMQEVPGYSSQDGVTALIDPKTGAITYVRDYSKQDVNHAGENREGENQSSQDYNQNAAEENQRENGYYGYGSV